MSRRPATPRDLEAPRRCRLCSRPTLARSGVCDRHPRRGRTVSALTPSESEHALGLVQSLARVLGCAGEPACVGLEAALAAPAYGGAEFDPETLCSSCAARLFLHALGRDDLARDD